MGLKLSLFEKYSLLRKYKNLKNSDVSEAMGFKNYSALYSSFKSNSFHLNKLKNLANVFDCDATILFKKNGSHFNYENFIYLIKYLGFDVEKTAQDYFNHNQTAKELEKNIINKNINISELRKFALDNNWNIDVKFLPNEVDEVFTLDGLYLKDNNNSLLSYDVVCNLLLNNLPTCLQEDKLSLHNMYTLATFLNTNLEVSFITDEGRVFDNYKELLQFRNTSLRAFCEKFALQYSTISHSVSIKSINKNLFEEFIKSLDSKVVYTYFSDDSNMAIEIISNEITLKNINKNIEPFVFKSDNVRIISLLSYFMGTQLDIAFRSSEPVVYSVENVKDLIYSSGYTGKDIATLLNRNIRYIWRLFQEPEIFKIQLLEKIAELTNFELEIFFIERETGTWI